MRRTPAGIFTRSQGQEGGLRVQPRPEAGLPVSKRKNGSGRETDLEDVRWNLRKNHNPICNLLS